MNRSSPFWRKNSFPSCGWRTFTATAWTKQRREAWTVDQRCAWTRHWWLTCWQHLESWNTRHRGSSELFSWLIRYRRDPPPAFRRSRTMTPSAHPERGFCECTANLQNSQGSASLGCRHMVWVGLSVSRQRSWPCVTASSKVHRTNSCKREIKGRRHFRRQHTCRHTLHQLF